MLHTLLLSLFLLLPDVQRKVESSLILEDYQGAIEQARSALDDPASYELLIKVLSHAGEEGEMLKVWEAFHQKFPEDAMKSQVLENLCWGVIWKGKSATGLPTKIITMIASAITQDIYAVNMLKEYIHDSNSIVRTIAAELAAHFGDETICNEISAQYRKERVVEVRIELLKAMAALKIQSMIPELKSSLQSGLIESEERKEIVKSLGILLENPSHDELQLLVNSPWAAERVLAAQLIRSGGIKEERELLLLLLKDRNQEVRKEALLTWGFLRFDPTDEIRKLSENNEMPLSVAASWVRLLAGEGEEPLEKWLFHEKSEGRLLASSAITGSGKYGIELAKKGLARSEDAFVKANCALSLLKQRVMIQESSEFLFQFLETHSEHLMSSGEPFKILQKSTIKHNPLIPNTPEVVNQVTRLEILNLLAIVEHPKAEESIRKFLKGRRWEVVGVAAETLLGEGDETASCQLEKLLEDPDKEIRLEAALLLATWGRNNLATPVLLEAYQNATRPMKIKILESLGRVGEKNTIPFLIDQLKSPSQIFRLIAASVLIQTLNH